jgi:hypothetical protein
MDETRKQRLADFLAWTRAHITGAELDALLRTIRDKASEGEL